MHTQVRQKHCIMLAILSIFPQRDEEVYVINYNFFLFVTINAHFAFHSRKLNVNQNISDLFFLSLEILLFPFLRKLIMKIYIHYAAVYTFYT